jgi:hypothetical protein
MAVMVAWLGGWGILIDAVFAVVVILTIFLLSRRNAVTAANAMSEVAESGTAVQGQAQSAPTRRQRAADARRGPSREGGIEVSITIDWLAFVQVFVAAMLRLVLVVGFYSLGLRLLVRAGRVPVVAPAEFTDAITVITAKDAQRAAKAAAKAAKKSPLTPAQRQLAAVGRLHLVRHVRARGARRSAADRLQPLTRPFVVGDRARLTQARRRTDATGAPAEPPSR